MHIFNFTYNPQESISKLENLGLTPSILGEIIKRSHLARSNTTDNHPNNSAGTYAWHEAVCAARDILRPLGWLKQEANNKALTVNPDRTIAIDISGGTRDTGLESGFPQTRNPKGKQTRMLVNHNQGQLFEFNTRFDHEEDHPTDEYQTWVLLYYFENSSKKKEIRYELSLPISMEHDRIVGWSERIICAPLALDEIVMPVQENEYAPEVDVEISVKNE